MTARNPRDGRKLDLVGRVFVSCLLVCLILSFFSPLCFAQKSTADILGTVTDSSGAVLPGVKITATNAETHDVRKETTDQLGSYYFTFLPPGTYSVRAESSGLKTITIDDLVVTVNEERRQDLALTVGTVQQEVRVTANPVTVNAENAT